MSGSIHTLAASQISEILAQTKGRKVLDQCRLGIEVPIVRKVRDDDAVPDLYSLDAVSNLDDDADCFMAHSIRDFGASKDAVVDVQVSSADRAGGDPDNGIVVVDDPSARDALDRHLKRLSFPRNGLHHFVINIAVVVVFIMVVPIMLVTIMMVVTIVGCAALCRHVVNESLVLMETVMLL